MFEAILNKFRAVAKAHKSLAAVVKLNIAIEQLAFWGGVSESIKHLKLESNTADKNILNEATQITNLLSELCSNNELLVLSKGVFTQEGQQLDIYTLTVNKTAPKVSQCGLLGVRSTFENMERNSKSTKSRVEYFKSQQQALAKVLAVKGKNDTSSQLTDFSVAVGDLRKHEYKGMRACCAAEMPNLIAIYIHRPTLGITDPVDKVIKKGKLKVIEEAFNQDGIISEGVQLL